MLFALDAIVVLFVTGMWLSYGLHQSDVNVLAGVTAGAFAVKGLLTFLMARKV